MWGKPETARRTDRKWEGKDGGSGICTVVCIVGWTTDSDVDELQWIGDMGVISGMDGAQDKGDR